MFVNPKSAKSNRQILPLQILTNVSSKLYCSVFRIQSLKGKQYRPTWGVHYEQMLFFFFFFFFFLSFFFALKGLSKHVHVCEIHVNLISQNCASAPSCLLMCNSFNPTALRKAKIVYNFGLSECNRVKANGYTSRSKICLSFLPPISKEISSGKKI